jgi:hypothetical protein
MEALAISKLWSLKKKKHHTPKEEERKDMEGGYKFNTAKTQCGITDHRQLCETLH